MKSKAACPKCGGPLYLRVCLGCAKGFAGPSYPMPVQEEVFVPRQLTEDEHREIMEKVHGPVKFGPAKKEDSDA
jgi:hypothetical protein